MDKARYTLRLQRGEPFARRWTFTESDGGEFTPIDLTGFHARLQVRQSGSETAELLLDASDADNTITIGDDDGWIEFAIPAADILDVDPGTYAFDFALVEPGGSVDYALFGPCIVEGRVTVVEEGS